VLAFCWLFAGFLLAFCWLFAGFLLAFLLASPAFAGPKQYHACLRARIFRKKTKI